MDLVRFLGGQLYVGGEARAAQAHDARLPDPVQDILVGQMGEVLFGPQALHGGISAVVFHHDALAHRPGNGPALFHGLDLAGAGADDAGGHEAVGLGQLLSYQNRVVLLDNGFCGFSDVLGQGEDHLAGARIEAAQGDLPAQLLPSLGMDSAAKG